MDSVTCFYGQKEDVMSTQLPVKPCIRHLRMALEMAGVLRGQLHRSALA